MFSDSDDDGGQNVQLTVNEHYAKAFQAKKEREELEKLKEKYGSDFNESDLDESTDSESAESEDEDGEELTPAVDAAILRTLARIRKKDPAIYDSKKNIFGEESNKVASAPAPTAKKHKDKSKPVTVRQVALDAVLNPSRTPTPEPTLPTHVEEQRALRDETIKAFHTAVAGDDDSDDDLLVLREKTKDELEAEEEEYKAYLEKHVGEDLLDLVSLNGDAEEEEPGSQGDDEDEKAKGKKKDKKSKKDKEKKKASKGEDKKKKKSKAEEDQEFLMNYILSRGWVDSSSKRIPTYHEITGDGTKNSPKKGKGKEKDLEADEAPLGNDGEEIDDPAFLSDASFESLASHFETSYNHRFEEPDAATIPSFPRHIETTVRREESKRKEARERKKARKDEELAKKKEEVRMLKSLKMKDIKRKLERIGMESGLLKGKQSKNRGEEEGGEDIDAALQDLDLEGDWDPEKHDRQLQELFGGVDGEDEEGLQFDEDGKPVWKDDIDLGDIYLSDDDAAPVGKSKKDLKKEKKKKKKKKKGGEDDEDEAGVDVDAMDADRIEERMDEDEEEWDGTEEMRKKKWNEYMAEIDELDFNDMVAGMPTRFRYIPVAQQSYSLDPVEILLADDKDLNEYMSVKKYAPYRQDKGDRSRWDPKQQEKLRTLRDNLKKRHTAFFGQPHDGKESGQQAGGEKKKRKGKKERMKMKNEGAEGGEERVDGSVAPMDVDEAGVSSKRKAVEENVDGDDSPGDSQKKKKRRRRQKKDSGAAEEA
ncbi:hypothetical protein MD484_g2130, partial [Candolleomyces efflorescens]